MVMDGIASHRRRAEARLCRENCHGNLPRFADPRLLMAVPPTRGSHKPRNVHAKERRQPGTPKAGQRHPIGATGTALAACLFHALFNALLSNFVVRVSLPFWRDSSR
jgi:hypothetical protein